MLKGEFWYYWLIWGFVCAIHWEWWWLLLSFVGPLQYNLMMINTVLFGQLQLCWWGQIDSSTRMEAQGAASGGGGLHLLLLSFCEVSPRQGSHGCNEEPPNPAGNVSLWGNVLLSCLKQGGLKGETLSCRIQNHCIQIFSVGLRKWCSRNPGAHFIVSSLSL